MDFDTFTASLSGETPPGEMTPYLLALWHDGKGNWEQAHQIAQDIETREAAWIHAYLHRREGDPGNAAYWYNRAGKPIPTQPLNKEWESLVRAFL